jgi:hypothetical protein
MRSRRRQVLPLVAALAAIVLTPSAGAGGDGKGQQPPTNETLPAITGNAIAASALTASTGDWSGPRPSFEFQWARCDAAGAACTPIAGQTASTHVIAAGEVATTLRVIVVATNRNGSATATSNPTALVAAASASAPPPSTSTTTTVNSTTTTTTTTTTTPTSTTTPTTTTPTTTTTPSTTTIQSPYLGRTAQIGVAIGYPSSIRDFNGGDYNGYMARMRSLGATVIRTDYSAGAGTAFESAYNAAVANELRVVPILIFKSSDTISSAQAKANDLASRYPAVKTVELGNEPNGSWSWGAAPNPEAYASLAKAAAAVLRSRLTGVYLIGPGLAEYGANDATHMTPTDFQRREIAAGLDVDCWGYHPYSDWAWTTQMAAMRQALINSGISEPLCLTETGRDTLNFSEAQQASTLAARIADARRLDWIADLYWYAGQDHNSASTSSREDRFGVFHTNWSEKPAAQAFRNALG